MVRAGIFPENEYFEELTQISSNQGTKTNEKLVQEELNEGGDDVEESEDDILEYESDRDVEATSVEEMMKSPWTVRQMLKRFLLVVLVGLGEV